MRTEVRVQVARHGGQHTSVPDFLNDRGASGKTGYADASKSSTLTLSPFAKMEARR